MKLLEYSQNFRNVIATLNFWWDDPNSLTTLGSNPLGGLLGYKKLQLLDIRTKWNGFVTHACK